MLPEMRIQRTVGAGIPSAVHVMLSDVLYSFSTISLILGATTDVKLNALLNGLLLAQKTKVLLLLRQTIVLRMMYGIVISYILQSGIAMISIIIFSFQLVCFDPRILLSVSFLADRYVFG